MSDQLSAVLVSRAVVERIMHALSFQSCAAYKCSGVGFSMLVMLAPPAELQLWSRVVPPPLTRGHRSPTRFLLLLRSSLLRLPPFDTQTICVCASPARFEALLLLLAADAEVVLPTP